jgi:hypothetical protein
MQLQPVESGQISYRSISVSIPDPHRTGGTSSSVQIELDLPMQVETMIMQWLCQIYLWEKYLNNNMLYFKLR